MAVGGWDSFAAIEPYLNAPSEDVIDERSQNSVCSTLESLQRETHYQIRYFEG